MDSESCLIFQASNRKSRVHDHGSVDYHKRSQFKVLFHVEPQHYSGEIPIGSDMIHVSGGDAERDFEDDWSRW